MPWCDGCDRFYTPPTLTEDGECPEGHKVVDTEEKKDPKLPWHFWLLVISLVIYLGWRLVQLIEWIISSWF